jgi:hypothetical protein
VNRYEDQVVLITGVAQGLYVDGFATVNTSDHQRRLAGYEEAGVPLFRAVS